MTYKLQHVDAIKKNAKGTLRELFLKKDKKGDRTKEYTEALGLTQLMDRNIDTLSGARTSKQNPKVLRVTLQVSSTVVRRQVCS